MLKIKIIRWKQSKSMCIFNAFTSGSCKRKAVFLLQLFLNVFAAAEYEKPGIKFEVARAKSEIYSRANKIANCKILELLNTMSKRSEKAVSNMANATSKTSSSSN